VFGHVVGVTGEVAMMSRRCLDGPVVGGRTVGGRNEPISSPSSRRVRRTDSSTDDDDDDDDCQDVTSSRRVTCPLDSDAGVAFRRPNNCNAIRGT